MGDHDNENDYLNEIPIMLSTSELCHIDPSYRDRIASTGAMGSVNLDVEIEDIDGDFKAPDGGFGWFVVFGGFMMTFIMDGIGLSYGLFLDDIESSFGSIDKLVLMFGGSLLTGNYLMMGPLTSAFSNQFGFRKVVVVGTLISSISLFISSFSVNIDMFIMAFGFFGGIGFGFIYLPSCTIIALWFQRYRALATGLVIGGSGTGVCVCSYIIPLLIDNYTWRGCVMILSAFSLNGFVSAALFRTFEPPEPKVVVTEQAMLQASVDTNMEKMITDFAIKQVENSKKLSDSKNPQNLLFNLMKETRERDQAKSTGSLNNMIITCDNKLVDASKMTPENPLIHPELIESIVRNYLKKKKEPKSHISSRVSISGGDSHRNSVIFSQISMPHSQMNIAKPSKSSYFHSVSSLRHNRTQVGTYKQRFANKISHKVAREMSRPILKPDLYYSGSIQHLYNENIRIPSVQHIYQSQIFDDPETKISPTKSALNRLLDLNILKSKAVEINLLANFLCMIGFMTPYMFMVNYSESVDINRNKAKLLMTMLGAFSTIGRISTGMIADRKWANCLVIHNIFTGLSGLVTVMVPFFTSYIFMVFYVIVFGISTAAFVSLKTIIIVDVMGVEKLTNIFGYTTLAQGIAIVFGPPILGYFFDLCHNYTITFLLGGISLLLSAILTAPLRILAKHDKQFRNMSSSIPSLQIYYPADQDYEEESES